MHSVAAGPVDDRVVVRALEGSRHAALWLDGASALHPRLTSSLDADLVIVGAGFMGLWTALAAIRRDPSASIVIVEAHRVGWAASGRSAGIASASLTHGRANGAAHWPNDIDDIDDLGMANLDAMQDDVERLGLDVGWRRAGSLTIAADEQQGAWLRERAITDRGVLLSGDEARAAIEAPSVVAGYLDRAGVALVDPARLAHELARVLVERGVRIFERSRATLVDDVSDGRVRVVTGGGQVTARHAVLATNAFPSLLKRDRLSTVPVYDAALATEPLSAEQLQSIGWAGRQSLADAGSPSHYARLTDDDRIIWGGSDPIYHPGGRIRPELEDRRASFERLARHLLTILPQLDGVRFSHRWSGVVDASTRFCAHYGVARGGRVAYANGFTGDGIAATRFAADVCLDLLAGEPTQRTELQMVRSSPLPFPPEPFASAGLMASRWSLDRAEHPTRNVLLQTLDALGQRAGG